MSSPVNIICMKWGDKYDASYVNKLYNMVSRNLIREFRFICLTDNNSGLLSSIESYEIPKLNLPEGIPERGWTKLVTFSKNIFDIKGQCLFLDLDLIIVDNIDQFFDLHGDFFIIKDFVRKDTTGNSSVYRFEMGKFSDVLENFEKNFKKIRAKFRNEQEYLSDYMLKNHSLKYWPIEWCQSFKKNCVQKGLKQFFLAPLLPKNAKIIIFHGKPNPPEALKGRSGKWYRKVLPTLWVADHWR
tara:strand:- start:15830 stop:16555 length:726 start_codon:yes stop_codon:yes gene_type:complete